MDATSNEPLPGARIAVVGKHIGAISGFDGSYKLNLAPGDYNLKFTYVGYLDTIIPITVTEGPQTLDIALQRNVKEVTVSGKTENGSDASAQVTMRNSDNLINTVSARTIEISPDLDVADVSQRLSGVTMTRTIGTGDAQYAIIRGMDKRYNYTTIDDIKIPSPDPKDRYVPLDIFPAELLDQVQVNKSLLPTMEGDAIGGTINLVMKQAPDHAIASVQVGSGYDGLFFDGEKFQSFTPDLSQSPRAINGNAYVPTIDNFPNSVWTPQQVNSLPQQFYSAVVGDRFDDDKLGIIAAGSYQNTYRGANTLYWETAINQVNNSPQLTNFDVRQYSTQQTRAGGMANLDYRADDDNTFQLFGMYASLSKDELRDAYDTLNGKGSWPQNDDVTHTIRTMYQNQGIGNLTLSGNDKIFGKDLEADWHLVYSVATMNQPDQSELSLTESVHFDSTGKYLNTGPQYVQQSSRQWTTSTDQDRAAYLNLKSTEDIFGDPVEFTYGGMYRSKIRSATYSEYDIDPNDDNSEQIYNGNINLDTLDIDNLSKTGSNLAENPLNYQAHENTTAFFGQGKFAFGDFSFVGGLRLENTAFGWTSAVDSTTTAGKTGSVLWADSGRPFYFLPSFVLKYSPTQNQDWRFSYFRSISLPNFYEVIPNAGVQGDDYTEYSNDSLQPTTANNFDLRWEYFPGGLDQLVAGVFYKRIHDPIEWGVEFVQVNSEYLPENLGDATNYGFELDFRKYFSNFGIGGNYTYTNSQITTPKVLVDSNVSRIVSETRPMEGQSNNIGNLSLLYKDFESGTDLQLSGVYTGPAIVTVSYYYDNDVWSTGFFQLDFSGEQRIWGNSQSILK